MKRLVILFFLALSFLARAQDKKENVSKNGDTQKEQASQQYATYDAGMVDAKATGTDSFNGTRNAAILTGGRTVHYDLYVKDTIVTFDGKKKRAIAVNGQIPMPTLEFTEGDTAEIVVHNLLNENTSLHWHGVFLPNKEDGGALSHPDAYCTTYHLHISFPDYSERNTLVSFPFRFTRTDRHVWQFYYA